MSFVHENFERIHELRSSGATFQAICDELNVTFNESTLRKQYLDICTILGLHAYKKDVLISNELFDSWLAQGKSIEDVVAEGFKRSTITKKEYTIKKYLKRDRPTGATKKLTELRKKTTAIFKAEGKQGIYKLYNEMGFTRVSADQMIKRIMLDLGIDNNNDTGSLLTDTPKEIKEILLGKWWNNLPYNPNYIYL